MLIPFRITTASPVKKADEAKTTEAQTDGVTESRKTRSPVKASFDPLAVATLALALGLWGEVHER